jgi:hypothetical protein
LAGRAAAPRTSAGRRGRGASGGGRWPDPSGKLAGSFRGDSRAAGRRKRRQPTPAPLARASSRAVGGRARRGPRRPPHRGVPLAHNPRRILAGSFRDPSGKLAGSFRDGSRTIRGRFEGVWAAKAPSDHAGDPGEGARRLPCPPGRAAASRWSVGPVCLHGFMANPFLGVHLNPTRQRAGPSQVASAPSPIPASTR